MYQNLKNRVSSLFSKAKTRASNLYAYLAVAFVALSTGSVMAQTDTPMTIEIPGKGVDWSALAETIVNYILVPVGLSVGISFAVWIILMGVSAIRKVVKV